MSQRKINRLIEFIFLSAFLISFVGFRNTIQIVYNSFKIINDFDVKLYSSSILTIMLKYIITFPIVGIILAKINVSRGKTGHYIGKVFYFGIGYFVALLLDVISKFTF